MYRNDKCAHCIYVNRAQPKLDTARIKTTNSHMSIGRAQKSMVFRLFDTNVASAVAVTIALSPRPIASSANRLSDARRQNHFSFSVFVVQTKHTN